MIDSITYSQPNYSSEVEALNKGSFSDPFSFLGPHLLDDNQYIVRAYVHGASQLTLKLGRKSYVFEKVSGSYLFTFKLKNLENSTFTPSKGLSLGIFYVYGNCSAKDTYPPKGI